MQTRQSLFKLGKTVAGVGLAGGCTALFGLALVGWFDAFGWGAPHSRAADFNRISYFDSRETVSEDDRASVRRLGLSAVLREAAPDELAISTVSRQSEKTSGKAEGMSEHAALDPAQDPHLEPNDVSVGDRITVVTPDGLSYIYRVTAREAADPALSNSTEALSLGASQTDQPATLDAKCQALSSLVAGAFRLVIESVEAEKNHRTSSEQKL